RLLDLRAVLPLQRAATRAGRECHGHAAGELPSSDDEGAHAIRVTTPDETPPRGGHAEFAVTGAVVIRSRAPGLTAGRRAAEPQDGEVLPSALASAFDRALGVGADAEHTTAEPRLPDRGQEGRQLCSLLGRSGLPAACWSWPRRNRGCIPEHWAAGAGTP